jgi:hypothetical protein
MWDIFTTGRFIPDACLDGGCIVCTERDDGSDVAETELDRVEGDAATCSGTCGSGTTGEGDAAATTTGNGTCDDDTGTSSGGG